MKRFSSWNRKLHIHIGLFLLLFIWLFSVSGLLLNHGGWKFASFWEERVQQEFTRKTSFSNRLDSAAIIRQVMQEFKVAGEINNVRYTSDALDFRVGSPGKGHDFHVDINNATITLKQYELNIWGKIRTLHTFNGVDKRNSERPSNWLITFVWRFAMDGIAVALIFVCISSWIMWIKVRKDYKWSVMALTAGFLTCFYFIYLLRIF